MLITTALLSAILLTIDSCKKEETVPPPAKPVTDPVFTIENIFIQVGGYDYIQFIARCTSENIKLNRATITDPGNHPVTYEYYSDTTSYLIFLKDEPFTFPEDFPEQSGIWSFTFTGEKFSNDSSFTSIVYDTIK